LLPQGIGPGGGRIRQGYGLSLVVDPGKPREQWYPEAQRNGVVVAALWQRRRVGSSPVSVQHQGRQAAGPGDRNLRPGCLELGLCGGQIGASLDRASDQRIYAVGENGYRHLARGGINVVRQIGW
jgi:hypothetical protein